ncbi:MAG: hypothetical protein K2G24_00240 [Muribaculaceae bacterium]|nr:hypothetical protein [Muribaculaceae bacterium]
MLFNTKLYVHVSGTGLTTLDLTFTPNSDVLSYTFCIFEEGQAKAQFEQFGPMFGFSNMGQMIQTFGGEQKYGALEYQYKQLEPNTDYELYVQPLDKNGNMAELQVFEMSTLKQGGSGAASVEILVGDYRLADWNGEMLPSQFFSFVPNDQTWSYRFGVYMAEQYDADPDACKEAVASEPPVPNMANWFFFAPITTDFQINPNTTVVAIAAAKNADGVWGEPTVLRHTTAAIAQPSGVKLSSAAKIASRMIPVPLGNRSGYGRVATSGINIVKL